MADVFTERYTSNKHLYAKACNESDLLAFNPYTCFMLCVASYAFTPVRLDIIYSSSSILAYHSEASITNLASGPLVKLP